MLQYTSNEGLDSSHFFITTLADNICILAFKKLEEEEISFNNDLLQNNVMEMMVVKSGIIGENFCKELSKTIKVLFDRVLEEKPGLIIYISVDEGSLKHQLIKRYVDNDVNDHFNILSFKAAGKVFVFFLNSQKTNVVKSYVALVNYFEDEYGIEFEEEF
jgi:hypothetical protein